MSPQRPPDPKPRELQPRRPPAPSPNRSHPPTRRRRSPLPMILLVLLVLLVGFLIYLSTVDSEVPTQRVEQDVTNEVLGK